MKKSLQNLSLVTGLVLLASSQIKAQVATLIQDVNTGTVNSSPTLFTSCGIINTIFFVADNGATGAELWKYDIVSGTASLVKDINTGASGSGITAMTANLTNNGIIFNANDGVNGNELWKSDGTPGGTTMVLDINTGTASSNPNNFYTYFGKIIFSADNGTNGKEPWLTNGNGPATSILKDINPGAGASDPSGFLAAGVKILFKANDGTTGSELWWTDMTAGNTLLLKDINTGSVSSIPQNFVTQGSTLYFSATDVTNGAEIWKSDGTLAGTQLVKDINTGTVSSIPVGPGTKAFFTVFNNLVYFQATDGAAGYEFWKSDGSVAGTVMVKDINTGASSSSPSGIFASPTNLFFTANDGASGTELWMSDGTTAGTAILKDINPGAGSGTSTLTTFVRSGSGVIYFTGDDGTNGAELWRTLESTATTTLLANINPGASSSPANMLVYSNILYFSANDGTTGIEPWKFDPNPPPLAIAQLTEPDISFEVYPNPSNTEINVRSDENNLEIRLFSVTGQLLYSQKINNVSEKTCSINTSELKVGVYFIKVISERGERVKKIMVN